MRCIALLAAVFCLASTACLAQEADPFGSGKHATYKLDDLPNDLVAVELTTSRDNIKSLFQMSMYSSSIAGSSPDIPVAFTRDLLMQLEEVIWMPKDQALSGGEFMLGYRLDYLRFPARGTNDIDPSLIRFRLTYVRRQAVIAMTPREDFSPSALKEMAKSKAPPIGTNADRAITLSNLKQLGLGQAIFLADNEDLFPYVQSTPQLVKLLQPYIKNEQINTTRNPMGGAFRFNMSLAGVAFADVAHPESTPLFYESEAWPDGRRGVCFVDTHAKFVTPEEWNAMQPFLKLNLKRHGKPIPPAQVK